jgi:hypothetical protein
MEYFFGLQSSQAYYHQQNTLGLSELAERRVRLLNGPYYKVFLKVWAVNNLQEMASMEVTGIEFEEAALEYASIIASFPEELGNHAPSFAGYISPSNYSMIEGPHHMKSGACYLSITGQKRWEMLHSPHAATLIRVWLIRFLAS